MNYSWWDEFHPFGVQHVVCLAVCVAIMVGVSLLGRRLGDTVAGNRLRVTVGMIGVVYWIGSNAWWALGPQYTFAQSLPLQVCDLAGLIGPVALLSGWRKWRAMLYFWGLSLSVQGFIQPVLTKGMAATEFWLFWANHTVIVGMALYDVIALKFRPTKRDYLTAVIVSLAYVAVIIPFDMVFQVNYGYVGPSDPIAHHKTLADKLGPWPLNAALLTTLGLAAMALLWLPWEVVRRRQAGDRS